MAYLPKNHSSISRIVPGCQALIVSVLGVLMISGIAAQTAVPITNHSFESPGSVKQTNWSGVPGWSSDSLAADSGVETGQGATDGLWTGFLAWSDPSVWNLTGRVIAAGDRYTLRIDARKTAVDATLLRVILYAQDGGSRMTLATLDAALGDAMQTYALDFAAADQPSAIGKRIGIELENVADGWVGMDNLRLSVVSELPYARYRSDQGVTRDSGGRLSRWDSQSVGGRDLDRVVGVPLMVEQPRLGGGSASVVRLDGSSAIWAAADDWGSISAQRTVVARARLKGPSDGFLFDGSTRTGLTRAQVRGGSWQAGVQPVGGFTAADPDTAAATVGVWQTHIFEYAESDGNTNITHWIDGLQVGGHTVTTDTNLSGLIVGANGTATGNLEVELVELIVYDRLLSASERSDIVSELSARWDDLNLPLNLQSSVVLQTSATVPKVGLYGLAALQLTSTGMLPTNTLTSLSYNLNGTTTPSDVEEVRLYHSGGAGDFDSRTAGLIATAPDPTGTFSLDIPIREESQTLWLAVKLRGTSAHGDVIDAEIIRFSLSGGQAGDYVPTVTAPSGFLTVDTNAIYSRILRQGGDDGSGNYRIPALVTTNAGTLIAAFDVRWDGNNISSPDLPADIDTAIVRSTDGGVTWGPMQIIMDYDENVSGSAGNGVGDPALLVDRGTGRIWCAALWSKGNNGWNGSGPGLTPEETGQFVLSYSDDDGVTWSEPVSITPGVKDPNWRLYFNGPGKGICTRDGILIFPAQYRRADGVAHSNFIYSTDNGATWQNSPPAYVNGGEWTSEAQIVELDNGDLLISMRNYVSRKQRLWNIFHWDKDTETIAEGTWGTAWYDQTDPTVMASVERCRSVVDGHPWSGLLFSNPDSTSREKMSIRLSLDEGQTWSYKRKIDNLPAAYSCMTILPDGDIGILYETGELSSISRLVFARFPLTWLVGTDDSDLDGIPDFEEDVLGLNRNDSSDAKLDSDNDGQSNEEEYLALTDLNDRASYFRLASIGADANRFEAKVRSKLGRNYELQVSSTLEPSSWFTVSDKMSGTGAMLRFDYPVNAPLDARLFFRVRVSAP